MSCKLRGACLELASTQVSGLMKIQMCVAFRYPGLAYVRVGCMGLDLSKRS